MVHDCRWIALLNVEIGIVAVLAWMQWRRQRVLAERRLQEIDRENEEVEQRAG